MPDLTTGNENEKKKLERVKKCKTKRVPGRGSYIYIYFLKSFTHLVPCPMESVFSSLES